MGNAHLVVGSDGDQEFRGAIIHDLPERPPILPRILVRIASGSRIAHVGEFGALGGIPPPRLDCIADRGWNYILGDEVSARELNLACFSPLDGLSFPPRRIREGRGAWGRDI